MNFETTYKYYFCLCIILFCIFSSNIRTNHFFLKQDVAKKRQGYQKCCEGVAF
jgi:hypothetical protein